MIELASELKISESSQKSWTICLSGLIWAASGCEILFVVSALL